MGSKNIIRLLQEGLVSDERFDLASGEVANFLPAVDDTGVFAFGDGTYDADVKIFLGDTSTSVLFDKGAASMTLAGVGISSNAAINTTGTATFTTLNATTLNLTGSVVPTSNGSVDQKVVVQNTNTTFNATHWGALVTNRAASDRNYTLPDIAAAINGKWFEYVSGVGQNTTFTANTVNTILALNTLNANSVALSTANEIIGASCKWICDGTSWVFIPGAGTATIVD
jgi:hypothetical protein